MSRLKERMWKNNYSIKLLTLTAGNTNVPGGPSLLIIYY